MAPGPSKKKKGKDVAEASYTPAPSPATPMVGILEVIPDPVAKVDLSDIQNLRANYVNCLEKITEAASSDVSFTLVPEVGKKKVVPVTAALDHTPKGSFGFELTDGESRLLIVCDKYQLWLRGIVTHNGSRYELNIKGVPKAMVGSGSLHTTGIYPHLLGDSVHICKIGYQSLLNAFHILVAYGGNTENHKAAIAVILVMFFEASRLQELYDLSSRLLGDKEDELVGETNRELINDWSDTSRDFFNENGHAEGEIKVKESTGAAKPTATQKVAKSVRILCRSPWDQWVKDHVPAVKVHEWKPSATSSRK